MNPCRNSSKQQTFKREFHSSAHHHTLHHNLFLLTNNTYPLPPFFPTPSHEIQKKAVTVGNFRGIGGDTALKLFRDALTSTFSHNQFCLRGHLSCPSLFKQIFTTECCDSVATLHTIIGYLCVPSYNVITILQYHHHSCWKNASWKSVSYVTCSISSWCDTLTWNTNTTFSSKIPFCQ